MLASSVLEPHGPLGVGDDLSVFPGGVSTVVGVVGVVGVPLQTAVIGVVGVPLPPTVAGLSLVSVMHCKHAV